MDADVSRVERGTFVVPRQRKTIWNIWGAPGGKKKFVLRVAGKKQISFECSIGARTQRGETGTHEKKETGKKQVSEDKSGSGSGKKRNKNKGVTRSHNRGPHLSK